MLKLGKIVSLLVIASLLLSTAPSVSAAPKTKSTSTSKSKAKHSVGSINGTVVDHKKKGVAGAKVHLAHKHKHKTHSKTATTAIKPQTAKAAKAKTATTTKKKSHHHGVTTAAGGAFELKSVHAGSHTVVAHKKHVGTGHAKVSVKAGQTANVTIRLHKTHHKHSGTTAKAKKAA